jgi:tRNA-2-methylthio-N6-dimethylallyladenosine synthase
MLYDDNPTIDFGLSQNKAHDETRQGEAFSIEDSEAFFVEGTQANKFFYIESYGCAMNFSDSEIVASILMESGYAATRSMEQADLFLVNTCSIREKAEDTVRRRLRVFNTFKKKKPDLIIGVLGCMAERLKKQFLEEERIVDMVIGPDAYRDLPNLINKAEDGERGVNVLLSRDETYADIAPVRLGSNGVQAFISIMRGCDNMCSFCVVPFTRGRERSRDPLSIVAEATQLFNEGYRDVTLLGQNVDSYKYKNTASPNPSQGGGLTSIADNQNEQPTVSPPREGQGEAIGEAVVTFANLLEMVALIHPDLRVRFSTSHPKDITDEVIFTIKKYENICNYIHLPVQSGNSRVLDLMNRTYDREWYMERVSRIYEIIPDCAVSSDIITGFCSETEEEHQDTLSIMKFSRFTLSYMYYYSERPGTLAARKYPDDIPEEVKKRRLAEVIVVQNELSLAANLQDMGKTYKALIESDSKRSTEDWAARTSHNKLCIIPKSQCPDAKKGDYIMVYVRNVSKATLLCDVAEQ